MWRWYVGSVVVGVALAALIVGLFVVGRARNRPVERASAVDSGGGPRVAMASLRALPIARAPKRKARTIVTVIPHPCNCEAELDGLAELHVLKVRFNDARFVFVTADPGRLDLDARATQLHIPFSPGADERFEQLVDVGGAAIIRPAGLTKPMTYVLDEHDDVLVSVSPLDRNYVESITLAADLKPRYGWEAKGDPKRADEPASPASLGSTSSGWCEVAREGDRAARSKLLKAMGARDEPDEMVRAKVTIEIGASGWLTRAEVHAEPALAIPIRWDLLRRMKTYRYERPSGLLEIDVECRAVPLRRWAR